MQRNKLPENTIFPEHVILYPGGASFRAFDEKPDYQCPSCGKPWQLEELGVEPTLKPECPSCLTPVEKITPTRPFDDGL